MGAVPSPTPGKVRPSEITDNIANVFWDAFLSSEKYGNENERKIIAVSQESRCKAIALVWVFPVFLALQLG